MARFCAQCGAEMVDNAAFCPKCGKGTGIASSFTKSLAVSPAMARSYAGTENSLPGLFAYLFIPAVFFLILARYKRNSFVRFHSFQSILLWVIFVVLDLVLAAIPVVNLVLLPVVGVGELVIGVICMVKAFQGDFFRLPVIGNFSESFLGQQ
jgi:uncharacterized membrane protein